MKEKSKAFIFPLVRGIVLILIMSMTDIIRQQKELKDKLGNPVLQSLLELKSQINPFSEVVSLIKNQKVPTEKAIAYKKILDSVLLMLPFSGITSSLLQLRNSGLLQQPDSNSLNLSNLFNNLRFSNIDFSKLSDAEINEEEARETRLIQINESSNIKKIITDIYKDNEVLLKISSREFEEMIAEILRSQGFEAELTKQTRDNGYDILAIKPINGHAPLKYLVECKRFTSKKVGVEIVRGFKNVVDSENANLGIIVATSYFTRDAKKKKNETPYLLDFRDKDAVIEWVTEYSESFKLRK